MERDIQNPILPDSHHQNAKIPSGSFILKSISMMVLSTMDHIWAPNTGSQGVPSPAHPSVDFLLWAICRVDWIAGQCPENKIY